MPYTGEWTFEPDCKCRHCTAETVQSRSWDSSDEAHTDYHYRCTTCNRDWWVEGIDS